MYKYIKKYIIYLYKNFQHIVKILNKIKNRDLIKNFELNLKILRIIFFFFYYWSHQSTSNNE